MNTSNSQKRESLILNYLYVALAHFLIILFSFNLYSYVRTEPLKPVRLNIALSGEEIKQPLEEGSKAGQKESKETVVEKKDDVVNSEEPDPWIPNDTGKSNAGEKHSERPKDIAPRNSELSGEPEHPSPRPEKNDIEGNSGIRQKGRIGPALHERGGDRNTEDAVKLGLTWLASVQDTDGKWDADEFMLHYVTNIDKAVLEGPGYSSANIGVTGLSLLAFTGAGNTDTEGVYRDNVARASKYLLGKQRADGGFGGFYATMYDHSIATLAMLDLYAASGNKSLKDPCEKAIKFLVSQQNPGGGWTYAQGTEKSKRDLNRNDLSITGWCVLCISTANHLGIEIDQNCITQLKAFLVRSVASDYQGIYADKSPRAWDKGIAVTAVSNISRRLLGERRDSFIQKKQIEIIRTDKLNNNDKYFLYYGTLALFQNPEHWNSWNDKLKTILVKSQIKTGPRAGSWTPESTWDQAGGRVYTTAMSLLSLEIYYRFEPTYMKDWNEEKDRKK